MKKYLAMLCATMLCVCCLGLAACGGSSSSSAASSSAASESASSDSASAAASSASASAAASSASASASASSATASTSYAGEWKFAGAQMDMGSGVVTMVGDVTALLGDEMSFNMILNEDGTGSLTAVSSGGDLTWVDNGNGITITPITEGSAVGETLDFVNTNGVLATSIDADGQNITLMFSKDGMLPDAIEINADNAKPITQESALVGDWKISGMKMMGLSIYGDSNTIASMSGSTDEVALSIKAGGTGTFGGEAITYTVGADGAALDADGVAVPVTALGDDIVVDLSGVAQMEMLLVYSK